MDDAAGQVAVCVCSYRRPHLLARLLEALARVAGVYDGRLSIVVIDNDAKETARSVVDRFAARSGLPVSYGVEPERNIARARNAAVRRAEGSLVAFVDDDEEPESGWLTALRETLEASGADGVLGPVRPRYETAPPPWIARSGVLERPEYPTGTRLTRANQMRTGNVLLRGAVLRAEPEPFDASFGLSGGEDVDFFKRMLARGYVFVWCGEAPVYETVPAARMTRSHQVHRALLRGQTAHRRDGTGFAELLKACIAVVSYAAALPVALLAGQHLFMRCVLKGCDHGGRLLAVAGVRVASERRDG